MKKDYDHEEQGKIKVSFIDIYSFVQLVV